MEKYFGDRTSFAIRYKPYNDNNHSFACLHLILKGQLIGDPQEPTSIIGWLQTIEYYSDRLLYEFENLTVKEFDNKEDEEIWEMIWKSNQLHEEYNQKYLHLPTLENIVWEKCHVTFDETTDSWLLAMVKQNENLKIMWKGLDAPCPERNINKLYSITVDKEFVIQTINELLQFFKNKNEITAQTGNSA